MTDNGTQIWNGTLNALQSRTDKITFDTWFKALKPAGIINEHFILEAPSSFHADFTRQYLPLIQENLDLVAPSHYEAEILLAEDIDQLRTKQAQQPPVRPKPAVSGKGTALGQIQLDPQLTFDTFVVGSGNRFAHAACEAVAREAGGRNYNPLFLYGGSGLGKTHLIQAIGNYIHTHHPEKRIVYVQSENFLNEFISTISSNTYDDFRKKYRRCDILLIDDIQFIEGKEQTQEEFFHTFNALYEAGSVIVLTCDKPPQSLVTLEERLRTRFASGLIVDVQAPDYETRVAILKNRAQLNHISCPPEVFDYIASNISSNIRELEGAFKTVMAFSLLAGEMSLPIAREALKDIISPAKNRKVTAELIMDVTARYYGVSSHDLVSTRKNKEVAYPRQVAMYLSRQVLDLSYEQIGKAFGNRHYTTVMHNCDKIEADLKADNGSLAEDIKEIKKRISV
ncbi:MAG: chromosomal replication initiator protein DnaA [Oscillospiraceae bacterium]|nr:chromosomal replication initiator protein DnaA [Oscillospiraceae bacterium]MDD4367398.1 chromosomal replication initiator protein DnaA [Oscillospiraceae bacterium]